MKKLFQIIGISSILIFSFYYTSQISNIIMQNNPLLAEIQNQEESLYVAAIDATIEQDYIIPGIYGSKVNVEESYYNMKSLNAFNEYYLVYDELKPEVSVEDNKDKIIVAGNSSKREVCLISEYNEKFLNIFEGYAINLLINLDTFNENYNFELLNSETNQKEFKKVETLLNKNKLNQNICLVNDKNLALCKENNNYLVKNSLELSNNLQEVKQSLENGSIILISSKASIKNVKLLIEYINYHDLDIVYLSQLISEKN